VLGAIFEVANTLGAGLLERVHERAQLSTPFHKYSVVSKRGARSQRAASTLVSTLARRPKNTLAYLETVYLGAPVTRWPPKEELGSEAAPEGCSDEQARLQALRKNSIVFLNQGNRLISANHAR